MTRVAESTPVFCTSCHGQYPERRHVDFEASYDGPIMQVDGSVPYPIEDLILCEDCVLSAAEALGFDALPDEFNALQASNDRLLAYVKELQAALRVTATALEHRPPEVERTLPKMPPARPKTKVAA